MIKLLALWLECFSSHVEPDFTFADSTASVEIVPIAGGVEVTVDYHFHFLGVATLAACLDDAVAEAL